MLMMTICTRLLISSTKGSELRYTWHESKGCLNASFRQGHAMIVITERTIQCCDAAQAHNFVHPTLKLPIETPQTVRSWGMPTCSIKLKLY